MRSFGRTISKEKVEEDEKMRGKLATRARQLGALERLKNSTFFTKGNRTEDQWQTRKDREIEILEKRVELSRY